jgi:hypothetical protein
LEVVTFCHYQRHSKMTTTTLFSSGIFEVVE